ncbi:MAG: cell division/cell wall cluster transcriptional repressor MraZ [Bacillales bacterium]|nr:cell division/cell wall cluster transcriptional repressor MraZ [Bacillales bacterium]
MFMGEFHHSIDTKGRVIVPSKFREELGVIYPMNEWNILEQKLKALSLTKKDARAFTRFFFSGATECEVDKQGRINIATPLINYASLEKECVVIGVSNRIEIWSKSIWEHYLTQQENSFAEIAENMLDFDL